MFNCVKLLSKELLAFEYLLTILVAETFSVPNSVAVWSIIMLLFHYNALNF